MRKTTSRTAKSTKATKSTMTTMVTNYLRKNRNASESDVYLHILRENKVPVSRLTLSQFLRDYSSYPSFRGVYETTRKVMRKNSIRRTSAGTVIPKRRIPATS